MKKSYLIQPSEWTIVTSDPRFAYKIVLRSKPGDAEVFAVTDSYGNVLTKRLAWEYEPMPSSRTEAFIKRTRFNSFKLAVRTFNAWCNK